LGRGDLNDAVVARKISVVREMELGVLAAADHESVMLIECERPAHLRPRYDI
jgi:hypothetical protein